MRVGVIIVAAGSSRRFNEGTPDLDTLGPRSKLDEDLGGRPVLQRTVELFSKHPDTGGIVVAGPHDESAYATFRDRHADKLSLLGVTLCRGGATHRYETVQAALEHADANATHLAVHDAARPCTPPELIDRVLAAARDHGAAVPVVEVSDTLKRLGDAMEETHDAVGDILGLPSAPPARTVAGTVDRAGLAYVQTPQVFEADLLRRAYSQDDLSSTDDAGLVERLGVPVAAVQGDPMNLKITRPLDIKLARAILGVSGPSSRPTHLKF